MVNQLKVNGKLQDVIITKNYKENELFKKLNKKEKLQKLKAHQDVEFCELGIDDGLTDA